MKPRQLPDGYAASLDEYLAHQGEAALERAYETGRAALGAGAGPLDLARAHHIALARALESVGVAGDGVALVRRAADFFTESLVPFEAIERGFHEIMVHLQRANEDLERKTKELEAVNGELEAFSYSVSHDLRAPLRAMDGFSQALMEDCSERLDEHGREHIQRIRAATHRMDELINGLLSLSRMTRTEMHMTDIDLSELAAELVDELQGTDVSRKAEFIIAPGVHAMGDGRLLRIVLANLLGNAWKFTRNASAPRIEFGKNVDERHVTYFVRDNGAGFDMAFVGKLFGAFQRLHRANEFEGSGIGLATVQRIVHRHGGRVWAEGAVGRGATFYFTVPPVKEASDGTKREEEHPPG